MQNELISKSVCPKALPRTFHACDVVELRPMDAVSEGCPCPAALTRCGVHGRMGVLVPSRLGLPESLAAKREETRLSLGYNLDGEPALHMVTTGIFGWYTTEHLRIRKACEEMAQVDSEESERSGRHRDHEVVVSDRWLLVTSVNQ